MKIPKSTLAAFFAGTYLFIACATFLPLIRDGYIGHGNGPYFLLATVVTAPGSVILFLLNDSLFDVNAFYMTGRYYYLTLAEFAAGALFNAVLIYLFVILLRRIGQPVRINKSAPPR